MKAFTSLLKKRAQAENTSSAPNGWTTQSVRNPCGCSSKLPGDGNLRKSAADCPSPTAGRRSSKSCGLGRQARTYPSPDR
jgi:hypothetical protein